MNDIKRWVIENYNRKMIKEVALGVDNKDAVVLYKNYIKMVCQEIINDYMWPSIDENKKHILFEAITGMSMDLIRFFTDKWPDIDALDEYFKTDENERKEYLKLYAKKLNLNLTEEEIKQVYKAIFHYLGGGEEHFIKRCLSIVNLEKLKKIGKECISEGLHRIYIDDDVIREILYIKFNYYKTGNVKSAYVKSEPISNSEARALFIGTKNIYYDVKENIFYYDTHSQIKEEVQSDIEYDIRKYFSI